MDSENTNTTCLKIQCRRLVKTYTMGEVQVPVLRGIDVDIHAGELTVILGASGAGKTTLLNIIGGIDRPTSGEVLFDGRDIALMNDKELTEHRRRNVGFVFQFYNLVPSLTALENVLVSTEVADDPMEPEKALELVGLGDRLDHFPAQMSGGQQQRVSIARALAKNPGVMFCDEPTGALDAKTGRMVLQLLTDLNQRLGTTIVIITHAAPIASLARRVVNLTMEGVTSHINQERAKAEDISW